MIKARFFIATLMCVILGITAQGMAFARGMPPAEGMITLCSGHGAVIVYVDAEGQPTSAPQLCSKGAVNLFAAVELPPTLSSHVPQFFKTHTGVRAIRTFKNPRTQIRARGPPTP